MGISSFSLHTELLHDNIMTTQPPPGDEGNEIGNNMNGSEDEGYSRSIHRPPTHHIEERIQITKDSSVGPTDVLCGRGKTSFNHCK